MNDSSITPEYSDTQHIRDQQYRADYEEWFSKLPEKQQEEMRKLGLDKPQIDPQGVGAPELDESRLADQIDESQSIEDKIDAEHHVTQEGAAEFPPEREALQDSLRVMIAELFESSRPQLTLGLVGMAVKVYSCKDVRSMARKHRKTQKFMVEESLKMKFRLQIVSREDAKALRRVVGDLMVHKNARLSLEVLALVSGVCYEGMSQTAISERHNVTRAAVSKRCVELTQKLQLPPSRAMKSEGSRGVYSEAQKTAWKARAKKTSSCR